MNTSDVSRATAASVATATELGLSVEDTVVLHNSNKLTLRLLPCDALARVQPATPVARQTAQFELELAQWL
ncbi:MAG TPA: aminoglycoside phosphotransferase family protein, partial [Pseudonocardiaceae bacterium]|nr:aminoglycoside phosphotransferase family protein [Pseudonocardiaceae bacterium]